MVQMKHILVATDFGEAADTALRYGRTLARSFGATLHVLHVAENVLLRNFGGDGYTAIMPNLQHDLDEAARKELDELLIDNDRPAVHTKGVLLTSNAPAFTIVDYAKTASIDLIVMGTHGRGGMAHLLMGSVAERVVRMAPCPVLTVHHPEHEFVLPDALTATARA